MRQHFEPLVAAHRQIRGDHPDAVMLLLQADPSRSLPPQAVAIVEDSRGDTFVAFMPRAAARAHFAADPGLSKWDAAESDAMDVAVVAAGGASLMRLTAR